jgi:hypothetical protein
LPAPIEFSANDFGKDFSWLDAYASTDLSAISLLKDDEGKLLFRLGVPQGKPEYMIEHNHRYDGVAMEKPAIYFDAKTGEESELNDKDIAVYYAGVYSKIAADKIVSTELIANFGMDYDFRNKRLPVWKVRYDNDAGDVLFIDPANGVLVDSVKDNDVYETYSFSFLHKWNFFVPLVGRELRDVFVVITLFATFALTVFGFAMLLRRKK